MLVSRSGYVGLPLGRFALRVHLLLPVFAVLLYLFGRGTFTLYAVLLGSLVLHELAHALTSLLLGGGKTTVFLHPLFGWAAVAKFPDRREAWTALAGPAANFLLAGALASYGATFDLELARASLADFLFTVSFAMGAGNLLPLPFTDGGRALGALRGGSGGSGDRET